MSGEAPVAPRRRWWRWLLAIIVGLAATIVAALLAVDTAPGHRFVAERIGAIRTANGLRFAVGRIDGSIYSVATLRDVRVYDPRGLVFRADTAALDWHPLAWFSDRLEIRSLHIPHATLLKAPETIRTGRQTPLLPDFDIVIGRLALDRLDLAPRVLGTARTGRVLGHADIRGGTAVVGLDLDVANSDRIRLAIEAVPGRDRFDIDVHAHGRAGGVLSRGSGIARAVDLDIAGDGSWARWNGRARGRADGVPVLDLSLANRAGAYRLAGTLTPATITTGKVQRLTAPRVVVAGSARFEHRRLDGTLRLRSAALAAEATGVIDLGESAFRGVRIAARLLQPAALFGNMTGRAITLRMILDGAFDRARFDYRLLADRIAFDQTGFETVRAAGQGRWSPEPHLIPIRLTAARVTGVGDVAGGILRNLDVAGRLRIARGVLTGDGLRLRSDRLAGGIALDVDLATGRFRVGLNGALGRYLIPGLGIVDVASRLQVVPGPGGHGTRVVGQGSAQVRRLDNAFFRSLTGGLPRIDTGLERGGDGVLHFTDLRLVSPSLRLAGNGYRRRDGTFHFEGSGRQAQYGLVRLVLDGDISRPTIDLVLDRPNAALGLGGVRVHLDPVGRDFAFRAAGGSRLGAFTADGRILLPAGGDASVAVDRLDVAGTRAAGSLRIVAGGFDGQLRVAGGGLSGTILFAVPAGVQRIEAHLLAADTRAGGTTLRRGRLDLTMRLDPAGTAIDATVAGGGLRQGGLSLGRFAANARLVDGAGEVRASIAGNRGRAFDIQLVAQVTPDTVRVNAQGTLDRRPLRLLEPAVVTRAGADGWRLAPTRLSFGGGEAQLSGSVSAARTTLAATVTRLPLAILDIGVPGLGLGGNASGRLSVVAPTGGAPTGRVDMTVRGLTRSGLVTSSRPIDMAVAGLLAADRLGVRAVMASGGRTVGRAQMQLAPLGPGSLADRIARAPLFAQLRYDGPADTLWRLTGIELFDLSGPVAIAADVGGHLARPAIRGALQARGARIESATTGTVLTGIQATGRFAGSRLQIDRFAAGAGGGTVAGAGFFDFAGARGVGMDLQLQATRAVMIDRDDFGATVTGPLRFRSDGSGGVISGDVVLDRSRYRLGRASAATPLPTLDIREINVPGGDGDVDDAPAALWRLDLHARARRALMVSGLGLGSEWSADLRIAGTPGDPAITGQARLIRGDYEFAGREFELERGIIRFAGEQPANPALDIAANADATGLSATIRVTGTALKPEIDFSSVPALPQDELLSRLLFGTSITNLSAPEALQLAAAVAALQNGGGGLNPINAVRRVAGLDRLRILPADPQTGQGTSVAAGKYVTRKLYAEIVTDGQGYSATRIEFQVTRWLSLLSSISTLGRQSANVRVSRDY